MQHRVRIKKDIPKTHSFVYKEKQYPINFYLFVCSSNYFSNNQEELKLNETIPLVDENYEFVPHFSDEIIKDFIQYSQREEIYLTNENVASLNYLAKKYEVFDLIEDTEEYISIHYSELILQILSIYQNDTNFETETYERILSEHFIEYINDDILYSLKIPVINRVLNLFLRKNSMNNKIFDFLLKCLDKFGRETSILFSNIDFEDIKSENLNLLLSEYSDKFDFHFINSSLLKVLIETQNDRKQKENIIEKMKDEIDQIKRNHLIQLNKQKQKYDDQINSLKNEILKMKEII